MKCIHCQSEELVRNGISRHGHQRWMCRICRKTCGEKDHRRIDEAVKEDALKYYLEGIGLRAIERLLGVSHVSVMNWVLEKVEGKVIAEVSPSDVQWVEADELWTYLGKKKILAGSGGLLIVLARGSAAGRWAIVAPRQLTSLMRNFLKETM